MNKKLQKLLIFVVAAALLFLMDQTGIFGGEDLLPDNAGIVETVAVPAETEVVSQAPEITEQPNAPPEQSVTEDGVYTTRDEVALYIHQFGHLPGNYITKKQAQALGWISKDGNLWQVAPGKCIGGDYFGNYEGLLPEGHSYTECDIDFDGTYRNDKRIIFSDDGWVYYTEDHYETFVLLYGED